MAETDPPSAPGAPGGTPTGLDLRRFAGRVLFPRTPADLTDAARCPACFSPLVDGACQDCRLDLSHPAAAELATLSQQSAELLDRRLEVIGRIRYDTGRAIVALEAQREAQREASMRARDDAPALSAAATDSFGALISAPLAPAARAGGTPADVRGATRPEPSAPEGAHPQTTDPRAPAPRRSSVQVILLIVGISLLSVAAIFFLVYAFINFGILGRSLVIAGVTIASFVVASTLRRRSLASTAEGIAVLAVVLVYLDAFAIRANDFFSLGSTDVTAFWGATLLVTAAGFLAWHRFSGLRTAHLIGFVAMVPGTALVVGGLADGADDGTRVFVAFAAAALAGVAHRFTGRPATATRAALSGRAERLLVLGFTGGALVGALVAAATLAPGRPWASTPAYLVVAVLSALQARLVGSDPRDPSGLPTTVSAATVSAATVVAAGFARVFAAVAGVSAAVAVAAGALRFGDLTAVVILAPVWAVLATLAGEWLWRRSRHSPGTVITHRRSLAVATVSAATVAAFALLYPLGVSVSSVVSAVSRSISSAWSLGPNDEVFRATSLDVLAVTALAACGLMTAAVWAAGGAVRSRDSILGGFAAVVLVVAVPLAVTVAAVVAAWLVSAAVALTGLLLSHRYRRFTRLRAPAMVLLAVSGVLGYVVSWGSTSTWWIGSLAAVALLLASRLLPGSPLGRATAAGTAAIIVLIGSAAAARQLALPLQPDSPVDSSNALRFVGCAAIVLIGVSAFRLTAGFSRLDRRVVFWVGLAAATASFGVLALSLWSLSASERMSLLLPEPGTSLAASAALLVALLLVASRPPGRELAGSGTKGSGLAVERVVASIALSPVLSLVVDSFARVIGLPELVRSVGPITAALLAAVGTLVVAARRVRPSTLEPGKLAAEDTNAAPNRNGRLGRRWARELGVLLVAVPSVVVGVTRQDSATWLVLLVAALVALVLATSPDGLVGSASPRRYIGWVSLALATAGLWWQLVSSGITNLEPYVLPLSGVLLLVALSVWRATPVTTASGPSLVAPAITLVALLASILPLAASGATGPPLRALLTGAISAALLLVGSIPRGTTAARPYLDSIGLAGALGVITVEVGQSTTLVTQPGAPDIRLDGVLVAGLVLLLVAAIGQARDRGDYSAAWRAVASQVLGVLALVILLAFELAALDATSLGGIRAVGVILLLCAVHVVAFLLRRAPFTHSVAWIAIAGAAVAGIGALVTGAIDVVEVASVPVAVALILTGAITLSRVSTARTWPWLAPGIAALLLPSLIATAGQPPLFRLVGLGVVAVAIIVVSAILRLQAPFLIAVVVVLVHAVATFAPQIRVIYESVEWWLWFVPVGIAVVVFAARFEKSVLGMKSVALRIRALR
ncbi:hypothetical protein [Frigoribacterium sp. UYMn621]|uniref:SCO7613 C-terminal domain-containing membrane protein n=1 Tax=Frigoribacterium sp. UYMn621 TaxID=3156343 RepID=UPI003390CD78